MKIGHAKEGMQPPIGEPFVEIWFDDFPDPLIIHPLMARFLELQIGNDVIIADEGDLIFEGLA